MNKTKVIFRKWKDNGQIIALFPENTDRRKLTVSSYGHLGQYADADYNGVISLTTLAREEEYKDLLAELKSIGYENLRILKKRHVQFY